MKVTTPGGCTVFHTANGNTANNRQLNSSGHKNHSKRTRQVPRAFRLKENPTWSTSARSDLYSGHLPQHISIPGLQSSSLFNISEEDLYLGEHQKYTSSLNIPQGTIPRENGSTHTDTVQNYSALDHMSSFFHSSHSNNLNKFNSSENNNPSLGDLNRSAEIKLHPGVLTPEGRAKSLQTNSQDKMELIKATNSKPDIYSSPPLNNSDFINSSPSFHTPDSPCSHSSPDAKRDQGTSAFSVSSSECGTCLDKGLPGGHHVFCDCIVILQSAWVATHIDHSSPTISSQPQDDNTLFSTLIALHSEGEKSQCSHSKWNLTAWAECMVQHANPTNAALMYYTAAHGSKPYSHDTEEVKAYKAKHLPKRA